MSEVGKIILNGKRISYTDFFHAYGYGLEDSIYIRVFYDDEADKEEYKKKHLEKFGCKPTKSFNPLGTKFNKVCKLKDFDALCMKELFVLNANNYGIFFAVNGGHSEKEVKEKSFPRAQFMEMDEHSLDEQMEIINSFALKPSIIVKTKKSLHCYWLLSDGDFQTWKKIQKRLIAKFNSDQKISDASRVMRVPGFNHCKDKDNPVLCTLVEFEPDRKYKQEDLLEVLDEAENENETENSSGNDTAAYINFDSADEMEQAGSKKFKNMCKYVEQFLIENNIPCKKGKYTKEDGTCTMAYWLTDENTIPWHDEYTTAWKPEDTLIMVHYDTGIIGLSGRHSHDVSHGWKDLLLSYRPPDQGDKHIESGIKEHNANKGTNALIVKPMSAYEIKPTEFLFKPYFPLKVVIVSAYPGSGKTYVGCKLAASVSKGIDFAKCKNLLPERRKVIYFSSEDGYEDTIGLRLMECHADMDNVLSVEFDDSDSLDFSDGRLETLIKQEEPALIIFDTLQNFIGNVNMNAANETTAKMRALVRLADQYKCCIVLIAHFNKNELGSAITRTIGSTDIVGKCRSYLCVGSVPDEDNTKFLSHEKCNVAQLGDTILFSITPDRGGITFTGTSTLKADDYAVSKRVKGKPSPELDTVKDFIVRNMPDGKRESKEMETLCSANNFSMTTVKRAKKMLGIRSVKEGKAFADATWYWQAPQEGFCGVNGFSPIDYTKETYDFDDEIHDQDEEFHDSG